MELSLTVSGNEKIASQPTAPSRGQLRQSQPVRTSIVLMNLLWV
eukprot:SAG25_NODE_6231_length_577_cov_0.476987_2_plen_43_part_01